MISDKTAQALFDTMHVTSMSIMKSIARNRIFKATSSSVFVFGSTRRFECLPQCDLDVIIHTPDSQQLHRVHKAINKIKREYNLDKVEMFIVDELTPLIDIIHGQTPDAGYLDVLPVIVSPEGSAIGDQLLNCTNLYNNPCRLALKLISEYFSSRLYNDRSNGSDINLKYTPGGYRDILYLDLYTRLCSGDNNRSVKRMSEIRGSLDRVMLDLQLDSKDFRILRGAVTWIIQTKSAILDLYSGTKLRGRAPMNLTTASLLAKSRYRKVLELPTQITPEEIVIRHRAAIQVISETIDRLMAFPNGPLWNYLSGRDRKVANIIRGIWLGDLEVISNVTRSISPEVHYGILSALICTDVLDASSLDTIARIVTTRPGYIYLNRLLLKSTKTHSSTVEYILNNNRISWDIRVEKRYKALAKQRLVLAEKGT